MKIAMVVAMGENREIGANGDLLWHLPADMAHFKEITLGHHVLMGRKTWESIPVRFRPLPGRTNLILSRSGESRIPGVPVFQTTEEAIAYAEKNGESVLMVIGGGTIYTALFPICHTIYLTRVDASFPSADTFFPPISPNEWELIDDVPYPADERNTFSLRFQQWNRKS